jgi:FG-GAP-like repeat/FG-GAP repeat
MFSRPSILAMGPLGLCQFLLAVIVVAAFARGAPGGFITAPRYPVGSNPSSVATGDFNGDGHLDLVVVNFGGYPDAGKVSILLGNGDGTLQAAQSYSVGVFPEAVAVGDFNGDGHLDLVVANSGSNSTSILLGNGDGTFQVAQNYDAGYNPVSVAVGDFNGDGYLDLAVSNPPKYTGLWHRDCAVG